MTVVSTDHIRKFVHGLSGDGLVTNAVELLLDDMLDGEPAPVEIEVELEETASLQIRTYSFALMER